MEKPFRPFDLPVELRLHIFEYVVVNPKCLTLVYTQDPTEGECFINQQALRQPSLTRTCRQLQEEALAVFNGCNFIVFEISCADLDRLGKAGAEWLHSMRTKDSSASQKLYLQLEDRSSSEMRKFFCKIDEVTAHKATMTGPILTAEDMKEACANGKILQVHVGKFYLTKGDWDGVIGVEPSRSSLAWGAQSEDTVA
jgi:hypothetical protein